MYTQTDALRLRLNCYAAVSFLILLICGALLLGLPLRKAGERSAHDLLTIVAVSRAQAVDAWMRHAQAVAWHVSLRPGLRAFLLNQRMDRASADKHLSASMGTTGDTTALSLIAADGTVIAHSGIEIPEQYIACALKAGGEVYISPAIPKNGRQFLLFSVPITELTPEDTHFMPYAAQRSNNIIGRVLLLRDLTYLQNVLLLANDSGFSTNCSIVMEDSTILGSAAPQDENFAEAAKNAQAGQVGIMFTDTMAYAFTGLHQQKWGLVASVPLNLLHANANSKFYTFLLGGCVLYILCMLGFYLLSRPLAGRILMRTRELEEEVSRRRTTQQKLEKAHYMLHDAYERRRALAGEILTMLEQSHRALATELHDNAGQQLTTLLLSLEYTRQRAESGEAGIDETCSALKRAAESVQTVQKSIRHMSHGLYPPALDLAGLSLSIEQLCHDFEDTGLSVHFSGTELPPTSTEAALALYRIAQEALTNIVRHAKAGEVHIALHREEGNVVLTVEDDGIGFDIAAAQDEEGLGVRVMRERALACGGTVTVESSPGKGTLVLASLPISGSQQAQNSALRSAAPEDTAADAAVKTNTPKE